MNTGRRYTFIDEDDCRFDPVDESTLRIWYHEGRISRESRIFDHVDHRDGSLHEFFEIATWEYSAEMGQFLSGRVRVVVGDITKQHVDAIVNAANTSLLGGGGVDGAIHDAGGSAILNECREIRRTTHPDGLQPGKAIVTGAGNLIARHVIHTVGPVKGYHADECRLLSDCYSNAIKLAVAHGCNSLAFPAISTGAFGYPGDEAARIVSASIERALEECPSVREVRLVFYSVDDAKTFLSNSQWPDQQSTAD